MEQPIIPPAQDEGRAADAAQELNAEDILREFSAQAEGEAPHAGEELPGDLPSVDEILNEFSAPAGKTPDAEPPEPGDDGGAQTGALLSEDHTTARLPRLTPEELRNREEGVSGDALPLTEGPDEAQAGDPGDTLTLPVEETLRANAPEAETPDSPEPQPEDARGDFSAPLAEIAEGYQPDEADGEPQSVDDILREFGAEGASAGAETPPEDADPLAQAEELPDLFPADYYAKEETPAPEEYEEPTVVKRPPQKKRSTARKVLHVFAVIGKYLLAIVIALAIAVAGLFGYLTLAEYNPGYAEVAQRGAVTASKKLDRKSFSILTLNTGYAALGEDADFFMDGGTGVRANSEEEVRNNMLGIEAIVQSTNADFVFLQELDTDSDRSFELNQWLQYEYDLEDYETRFALNYSCDYVPYPIPTTIGKVHSGIATFSRCDITSATRYSLPCPFTWPTRIANLKRCMLVTRIPIEGSEGKELVLVNFHLEAYDDGEGKAAQTEQLMNYLLEEYEKGNYVIAGGDFNQCFPGTQDTFPLKPTSEWAAGQLDRLPTGWRYAYDDSTPTCRLLNQPYDPSSPLTQYYVIDGFIVSPNLTVTSVETLDEGFVYSDHNPVLMEITLNP